MRQLSLRSARVSGRCVASDRGGCRVDGLEPLEPRVVLSAVTWVGGGGDNLWGNPLNWSTQAVPNASSDVLIESGGPSSAIILAAGPVTIRSLLLEARLIVNRGVTLNASSEVNLGEGADLRLNGLLNWAGGIWAEGAQAVINPGGKLNVGRTSAPTTGSVSIGLDLINQGYLAWRGGDIELTSAGSITNAATKLLDMASPLAISGEGTLTNYGLLRRGGLSTTTTTIDTTFFNDDRVRVLRGTLALGASDPNFPSMINYGVFSGISTGSVFLLRSPTFHRDAEFRGNARYDFSDSTHIFRGEILFTRSTFLPTSDASISFGGARFSGEATVSGTSLFLEGDLDLAGTLILNGTSVDGSSGVLVSGTLRLAAAALTIDVSVLGGGRIESTGASTIQGDASNAGTIDIASGTLTINVDQPGDTGLFLSSGSILLAQSARLGIIGDFTTSGIIDTTIGATTYGKVTVTGDASLGGTLRARFAGAGFTPTTNFTIVSATGPRTGSFSTFTTVNTPAGLSATMLYTFNAARVRLQ